MNKSDVNWYGPWVALVTPFTAEGKIDEEAYQRNADLCIQYGCTGLVANGCMGEFWSLSAAERQRILELCVEAAAGRATVIGNASAIPTAETIGHAKVAKQVGCDGIMVLPPYFVKPPIFLHFFDQCTSLTPGRPNFYQTYVAVGDRIHVFSSRRIVPTRPLRNAAHSASFGDEGEQDQEKGAYL